MRLRALALGLALSACVAAEGPGGLSGAAGEEALAGATGAASVARACGVGRRPPGRVVEASPAEGRARWRIYDTAPGSVRPRAHYITGFSDGCARQVNAALVVFGGPAVYEAMRLSAVNRAPGAATDTLFGRIRSRICGVGPGAPCPAERMRRLEARTTFVSVYPSLGAGSERLELLLDNGDLVAQARLR